MTSVADPKLWLDWCAVTDTPSDRRDEPTLLLFTNQARPSRRILDTLVAHTAKARAPSWPRSNSNHHAASLEAVLRRSAAGIRDPGTHWITRLRIRRMRCCAVLIAPAEQGGLGLTRRRARALTPMDLLNLWPQVGIATEPSACSRCALWAWLEVLGTNNGWTHSSVRAVGYRRDNWASGHRHELADLSDDWRACPGLLPAIDRWGYVDLYSSMHPSSLSAVAKKIQHVLDDPAPPSKVEPRPATEPRGDPPLHTPEEEARILARADAVNARIAAILNDYVGGL